MLYFAQEVAKQKYWSLIKIDNTLVLLAILCAIAAFSIYLEQSYRLYFSIGFYDGFIKS